MNIKYRTKTVVGFIDQNGAKFDIDADTEFFVTGAKTRVAATFVLDVVTVQTIEEPPRVGVLSKFVMETYCEKI